jgi:TetR/AcrR family transcriptional regulator
VREDERRRGRDRARERLRDRSARAHDRGRQPHGRERDAEASRRALLAAAEDIFARDGFDGARVDDIARTAGYNKSLIFQYFDDKEGLYRQVVWCTRDDAGAQIGAIIERFTGPDAPPLTAETARAFIETCVRWTFDFFLAHPHILRIHAWEAAEGWHTFTEMGGPAGEAAHKKGKHWAAAVVDYLARAQQAGYLRPELDPRLLVFNVMSQAEHYLISIPRFERIFAGADLSSPQALTHAREHIVALFLNGAIVPQQETQDTKETLDATGL